MFAMLLVGLLSAAPSAVVAAPDGYQAARWGMTQAQVKKLFPTAKPTKDVAAPKLAMTTRIAGLEASVQFVFLGAGLQSVVIFFTEQRDDYAQYVQDFVRVDAALADKYGAGDGAKQVWSKPEHSPDVAAGLEAGLVQLGHYWHAETTTVLHQISPGDSGPQHFLQYYSPKFDQWRRAQLTQGL